MKKLIFFTLILLTSSLKAQFLFRDGTATARVDTISVKSDTAWIKDKKTGSLCYIRTSGDTLFLGDVSGEKALGAIGSAPDGMLQNNIDSSGAHWPYPNKASAKKGGLYIDGDYEGFAIDTPLIVKSTDRAAIRAISTGFHASVSEAVDHIGNYGISTNGYGNRGASVNGVGSGGNSTNSFGGEFFSTNGTALIASTTNGHANALFGSSEDSLVFPKSGGLKGYSSSIPGYEAYNFNNSGDKLGLWINGLNGGIKIWEEGSDPGSDTLLILNQSLLFNNAGRRTYIYPDIGLGARFTVHSSGNNFLNGMVLRKDKIIFGKSSSYNFTRYNLEFDTAGTFKFRLNNSELFSINSAGKTWSKSYAVDTTETGLATKTGQIAWNQTDNTYDFKLKGGVTGQLFQEQHEYAANNSGSQINDGQAVYATPSGSDVSRILLADNRYIPTAYKFIGVATQNIAHGSSGYITTFGKVRGLNTNSMTEGEDIYLSTSGGLTQTKPTTAHIIKVGWCVRKHISEGVIFVNPDYCTLPQFEILNYDAADGAKLDTLRGLILKGKAKVWNDISIGGFSLGTAAAAPVFTSGWAGSSSIGANYFQGTVQNDIAYFNIQVPHNTSVNDSLTIHIHGGPTTTPVSTDTVVFRLTYSFAEIGATFPSVSQTIIKIPLTGQAQWSHNAINLIIFTTGTGKGLSGIYNCSIERLQDNASDTYAQNWGLLSIDAHAKIDRLGSNARDEK